MFPQVAGLILIVLMSACSAGIPDAASQIRDKMHDQEVAWNNGDLEGFMKHYWHSDSLKFIGKSGLKYGWQTTLENYKKSYPDKAAMGRLGFRIKSVEQTGGKSAFVIGEWHLYRTADTLGGYYTLLWKFIDGEWVIVADHSS